METLPLTKKTTKKVRRSFLNTLPQEEEEPYFPLEYTYDFLTNHKIRVVNQYIGMVEIDQEMLISPKYMNIHIKVNNSKIVENDHNSKAVRLNVKFDHRGSLLPWEYVTRKLESFNNIICKEWSSRLRKYHESLPVINKKYLNTFYSMDQRIGAALRKIKAKVIPICREIESKYSYRKAVFFANMDSHEILETSYSEKFLKKMGHSLEGFMSWIQENPLPALVDSNSPPHLEIVQRFLNDIEEEAQLNVKYEGSEYTALIDCKDGRKKLVRGKYITVIDPTPEGFFTYAYFVIARKKKFLNHLKGSESQNKFQYDTHTSVTHKISSDNSEMAVEAEFKEGL